MGSGHGEPSGAHRSYDQRPFANSSKATPRPKLDWLIEGEFVVARRISGRRRAGDDPSCAEVSLKPAHRSRPSSQLDVIVWGAVLGLIGLGPVGLEIGIQPPACGDPPPWRGAGRLLRCLSYSLISPPRTLRRRTSRPAETGFAGRGRGDLCRVTCVVYANCSDEHNRPARREGALRRRSAAGPDILAARCPPIAPRTNSRRPPAVESSRLRRRARRRLRQRRARTCRRGP
jgi:hypothetical protein